MLPCLTYPRKESIYISSRSNLLIICKMEEFKIKKQGSMYNNSCVYCHNVVRGDTKSDLFNLDDTHWQLNLMRDYPVLDVYTDPGLQEKAESIWIHYCPMCGRFLG